MAIKRSKADLDQAVRIANRRVRDLARQIGVSDPGDTLWLDRMAGGYRVTQETTGGGERDLSPRGTISEVTLWMEGFIDGIDQAGVYARELDEDEDY